MTAPRARPPAETQDKENTMSEYDDLLADHTLPAAPRAPVVEDRLALFYLSGNALLRFLSEGIARPLRTEGLPPDARFVDAHYLYDRRCFAVTVWSATFEPVPEYVYPPVLMVKVTPEGFAPDPDRPPDPLPELRQHEYDPDSFYTGQG